MKSSIASKIIPAAVLAFALLALPFTGCNSGKGSDPASVHISGVSGGAGPDTDGDGIPDTVEKMYGTNPYAADTDGDGIADKTDPNPVSVDNPIHDTSMVPLPLQITDARAEDNATDDHLEITVKNTGSTVLNQFDIYFSITDDVTRKQESYYQVLNGLTLNPGAVMTIHFDNRIAEAGHYPGNMSGLYGHSTNGLTFDILLHAKGYQPLSFQVKKAKGTAEVAD